MGNIYKYDMLGAHGEPLPQKADPVAWAAELPPATGSIVVSDAPFRWTDGAASLPSGAGTIRIEVLRQLQYLAAPVPQDTEAHSAV